MFKLIMQSNFIEDGMFFNNRVFSVAHGYMRNHDSNMQIGFNKENNTLYFYHEDKSFLENFLKQDAIEKMVDRIVYDVEITNACENELMLKRVNKIKSPVQKANEKLKYYQNNNFINKIDDNLVMSKEQLIEYYTKKNREERDVFFTIKKDDVNISFFGQTFSGNPSSSAPNSYGMAKRKSTTPP